MLLLNLGLMRPVYCTFMFNVWAFLNLSVDSTDKILLEITKRRILRQSVFDTLHNVIFLPLFSLGDSFFL